MTIVIVKGLSEQYREIAGRVPRAVSRELKVEKARLVQDIGEVLERATLANVRGQRGPTGRPWAPISGATVEIRRAQGFLGRRLGVGPRGAMVESLRLGGKGNQFGLRGDVIRYGSILRRGGHLVVGSFGLRYTFPKTLKGRARMAAWMWWITKGKIRMRRRGKRLVHPARRVMGWTPRLKRDVRDLVERAMLRAVRRAYKGVLPRSAA